MSNQLFDNFLKDKLGQYDSGAPMHVWERIREKEKDGKSVFFWWKRRLLVGVMLLGASVLGFLLWSSAGKKTVGDGVPNTNNIIEHNNKIVTENQSKTNLSTQNLPGKINNYDNDVTVVSTAKNSVNPSEINQHSTTAANFAQKKEDFNKQTNNKVDRRNSVRKNSKTSTSFLNGTNVVAVSKQFSRPLPKSITIINYADGKITEENNDVIHFAANELLQRPFRFGLKPSAIAQNNERPTCPTISGPRRNDWCLEIYGSPDYTMRSFSNSSSALNYYVSYRKENEDNRNGFSAGVRLVKNFGRKTVLKAGANYSQINERLKLVTQNEKQITQIITMRTIIRGPNDTLFVRDTSYFEQSGIRYRTIYNRYRFIDMPVLFSYEFGNPDIVSFAVNAGPVINVASFYRGEVLDTFLRPVKISTNAGNGVNNWRSNIGLGVIASFSVYKHINGRLQIFAEPYFRYNFKPVSQNIGIVNQRYSISGMQLGIRYKLNSSRQRYRY